MIVTTPQPAAQTVAHRAAQMADKVELEVMGVIENMAPFTTPDGQRFSIFGEGGGETLADELGVPLLGSVPLEEVLREGADEGTPLSASASDSPAANAIRDTAAEIVSLTPTDLPLLSAEPALAAVPAGNGQISGTELPVIQSGGS